MGSPSGSSCGPLCQLEVCLLLQLDNRVVYQEGLDRGLELVVTLLPESLACSAGMLDYPTFLQVDLSQFTAGDHVPNASSPHSTSAPTSPTQIVLEHLPKSESHISMTAEVQELLSCTVLDTSSQALGNSTPKRLTSVALGDPSSLTAEGPPKPLDTSSQASLQVAMPDVAEPIGQAIPPTKTPGVDAGVLPEEVILLQEEINKALGHLLMTKTSLDTHQ